MRASPETVRMSTQRGHADLVAAKVRYWHLADIRCCGANVRFRGQSRHDLSHCICLLLTQSGHPMQRLGFFLRKDRRGGGQHD